MKPKVGLAKIKHRIEKASGDPKARVFFLGMILWAALSVFYSTMYLGVLKSATELSKLAAEDSSPISYLFAHIPFVGSSVVFGIHFAYLILVGTHAIASKPAGYEQPILSTMLLFMLCLAYILPAMLLFYLVQVVYVDDIVPHTESVVKCIKVLAYFLFACVYGLWTIHSYHELREGQRLANKERSTILDSAFWFYVDLVLAVVLVISLAAFGLKYVNWPYETKLVLGTVWKVAGIKEGAALVTVLGFIFSRSMFVMQRKQYASFFMESLSRSMRTIAVEPHGNIAKPQAQSQPYAVVEFFGDDIATTNMILSELNIDVSQVSLFQSQPISSHNSNSTMQMSKIQAYDAQSLAGQAPRPYCVMVNLTGVSMADMAQCGQVLDSLPTGSLFIARGPAPTSFVSFTGRNVARGNLFSLRSPKLHRWDLLWLREFVEERKLTNLVKGQGVTNLKRQIIGDPAMLIKRILTLDNSTANAVAEFAGLAFHSESTARELWKHMRYANNHSKAIPGLGQFNVDEVVYVYEKT